MAAIDDAKHEKGIENADLLDEIGLILPDYFLFKSMRRTQGAIELEFYNGDIKKIYAESVNN